MTEAKNIAPRFTPANERHAVAAWCNSLDELIAAHEEQKRHIEQAEARIGRWLATWGTVA